MAKLSIKAGATSESIDVFIQDKTKTDGSGLPGLVFNSAGLTCYRNFPRGTSTVVALVTLAAPNSAWSSGGFKEIDATNQPGHYRFDIPDALLAAGNGRYVKFVLRGAASMADLPVEIELTGWDNQDATAGGIGRIDATISSRSTYAGGAVASVTAPVTVGTNNDKNGYSLTVAPPTAAAIATAIFTDTTASDFTTNGSPGKILVTQLGGAFTTTSSSIFTAAALANGPSGAGSNPWTQVVETGITTLQVMEIIAAALGGNIDGTTVYAANNPGTPRIHYTTDVTGARTITSLSL